ncbi:MAG: Sec-independent protein translocase protein TatA [Cyanobacteriota bacterium]|jgi:sec-independent protein translocase protein TatA
MNIFGIGLPEMAVIAAIGLLVFGPKRLPELGKTLGRTLKGFQSASQDFEKEFRSAMTVAEVGAPTEPAAPAVLAAADGAGDNGGPSDPDAAVAAEASSEAHQA